MSEEEGALPQTPKVLFEPPKSPEPPTKEDAGLRAEPLEEPLSLIKKKKVISAETKAMLLANLKRGRETSLANRKKKKKLADIKKNEKLLEEDTAIFESLKKKLQPAELKTENARLKKELAEARAAPSPKEERPKTPTPSSAENVKTEVKNLPTIPEKKELTSRQKMKLLRGL